MPIKKAGRVVLGAISALLLASCGGGGGSAPAQNAELTGTAAKGFIRNGLVKAFKADGTALGTATTDNNGTYRLPLTGYTGPVRIEVESTATTKIFDEVTGNDVNVPTAGMPLLSSVGVVSSGESSPVLHATPFTTVATKIAGPANALTEANVNAAVGAISLQLGFPITITKPLNPRETPAENENEAAKRQAVLLAGIANWVPAAGACSSVVASGQPTRGTTEQFRCAVEALKEAYKEPSISGTTVRFKLDGKKLDGLSTAVENFALDDSKNKTGKRIASDDSSVDEFKTAEDSKNTGDGSVQQEVAVSDANKSDVDAVKNFVKTLKSNAAALGRKSDNDALAGELTQVKNNFLEPGLALVRNQLGYLEALASGIALLNNYENPGNGPRSTFRADVGPFEDFQRLCVVVNDSDTPPTRNGGFIVDAEPASDASDASNTVLCGFLGREFLSTQNGTVVDGYFMLIEKTGTNAFRFETDSRVCKVDTDFAEVISNCVSQAVSRIELANAANSRNGTVSGSTSQTSNGGRVILNFDGKFVSTLQIVNNAFQPRGALHVAKGAADLSETGDSASGTFSFEASNTDTNGRALKVALQNGNLNATSAQNGIGTFGLGLSITAPEGEVAGTLSLKNTEAQGEFSLDGNLKVRINNTLNTLFSGTISGTGSNTDDRVGSLRFNGAFSLPNRPELRGVLNVATSLSNGVVIETLSGEYNQGGVGFTVEISGPESADNPNVTITLLSNQGQITGKANDRRFEVKKGGKLLAAINVDRSEVQYADGAVETY